MKPPQKFHERSSAVPAPATSTSPATAAVGAAPTSPGATTATSPATDTSPCSRRGGDVYSPSPTACTAADAETPAADLLFGRRGRAVDGADRGRLPVGLDHRPRVVQQGAHSVPDGAGGRGGGGVDGPGGVQGNRQAARRRHFVVRAQVLAPGTGSVAHGPAPERGQNAPDIRDAVHRPRVHGLLRDWRPAKPPAARQDHTAVAGTHLLQVSSLSPPGVS